MNFAGPRAWPWQIIYLSGGSSLHYFVHEHPEAASLLNDANQNAKLSINTREVEGKQNNVSSQEAYVDITCGLEPKQMSHLFFVSLRKWTLNRWQITLTRASSLIHKHDLRLMWFSNFYFGSKWLLLSRISHFYHGGGVDLIGPPGHFNWGL